MAVGNGNKHARVVLADLDLIGNGAVDAGFDLRKALFFADRKIVALVDTLGAEKRGKDLYDVLLPGFQAKASDLKAQIVCKFIDRQAGKAVGFAEDDAAGVLKAQSLAGVPGAFDAAAEKVAVDLLVRVTCQDADFLFYR